MTYRAGLIGLSGIGARHRDGYERTDGIELVAIADVDADLVAKRGSAWGIPPDRRYASHQALLDAERLDAVSIATPSYLHRAHALDAVESPAMPEVIWCEKPIAGSVSDAHEMTEACERAGVDLLIDHNRRFSGAYRTLRDQLADAIGEVQSVHVQAPEELLRNGTHMIDLLTFLLDERAERVMAHVVDRAEDGEWDDAAAGGVVVTDSGTYVNVDCTTPRETTAFQWLLVGEDGKIEFSEPRDECRFWRLEGSDEGSYGTEHVEATLPIPIDEFDVSETFAAAASNVVGLLDGTAENRSPPAAATHVLETIVAMFVSHHTGTAIDLPLDRPLQHVEIRSR